MLNNYINYLDFNNNSTLNLNNDLSRDELLNYFHSYYVQLEAFIENSQRTDIPENLICTHNLSCNNAFENLLQIYGISKHLNEFLNHIDIESCSFIDLSHVETDTNFQKIGFLGKDMFIKSTWRNLSNRRTACFNVVELKSNLDSVELPFEEGFYKLEGASKDTKKPNMFMYLKEYSPEKYIGIYIVSLNSDKINSTIALEFQINIDKNTNTFNFELYMPCMVFEQEQLSWVSEFGAYQLKSLLGRFSKLNKLNHKSNIYRYKGETPKQKYKIKGKKEYLRKTVYVYLNKEQTVPVEYTNVKLKREISWMVRGHWRRLHNNESVGKNAKGERVVEGFTWVKPHMCGNGENIQPCTLIVKE